MQGLTRYICTCIDDGDFGVLRSAGDGHLLLYDDAVKYVEQRFEKIESALERLEGTLETIRRNQIKVSNILETITRSNKKWQT